MVDPEAALAFFVGAALSIAIFNVIRSDDFIRLLSEPQRSDPATDCGDRSPSLRLALSEGLVFPNDWFIRLRRSASLYRCAVPAEADGSVSEELTGAPESRWRNDERGDSLQQKCHGEAYSMVAYRRNEADRGVRDPPGYKGGLLGLCGCRPGVVGDWDPP